jgi:hypothetical protein
MKIIDFRFVTQYGEYSDEIVLTEEEYSRLTETDIEEIKQQRLNEWIQSIEIDSTSVYNDLDNNKNDLCEQFCNAYELTDEQLSFLNESDIEEIKRRRMTIWTKLTEMVDPNDEVEFTDEQLSVLTEKDVEFMNSLRGSI